MRYLSLKNVSKTFTNLKNQAPENWVLDNINLDVNKGDILALLGPSGCGKTTLLRLITGLEQPDSGCVLLKDKEITTLPTHKREFGMMFQDFALFPHRTVAENISFGLEIDKSYAKNRILINQRVQEVLNLVNLSHTSDRYIQDLSGGEKQRIALARTLAPKPKLILLDEPLGSLDRALREELMFELREILKKTQMTAIFVTHDQTEAFSIADQIAVMDKGQIVQHDDPETLYFKPINKLTATFLGFRNLFDAIVTDELNIETPIGQLDIQSSGYSCGDKVSILIRPELAALKTEESPILSDQLLINGKIKQMTFLGGIYQINIQLKTGEKLSFKFQNRVDLPEVGSEIKLIIEKKEIEIIGN